MTQTIRSVDDLAKLPDAELLACFQALRRAILQARCHHAAAVREGRAAAASTVAFDAFSWSPRGGHSRTRQAPIKPDTPLTEISMRVKTREALHRLHIYCVEDLSETTEAELMGMEEIGIGTVAKVRGILSSVGLALRDEAEVKERMRA
ncbi:hypothetical protein [Variovorax saccharolyticus]|uniref:hypothetical protein n=1 Tax=Variovorax saccharolyticus TaxID=3053516 RepID=UPI002578131C|nr:hypothetical protein [Variovorax sp. J22R187]MDM0022327.1 hypothetical protein [Variovorax sp. J22R187]